MVMTLFCGQAITRKDHQLTCKANSRYHIHGHDEMVQFLIKKMSRDFKDRLVSAANNNCFPNGMKADIELEDHG